MTLKYDPPDPPDGEPALWIVKVAERMVKR
mgnify:CR=1 FL=1